MARTEGITSLRWEHPGIGGGIEGGAGAQKEALHGPECPQRMAKCVVTCKVLVNRDTLSNGKILSKLSTTL